jgi:hypothetical protein
VASERAEYEARACKTNPAISIVIKQVRNTYSKFFNVGLLVNCIMLPAPRLLNSHPTPLVLSQEAILRTCPGKLDGKDNMPAKNSREHSSLKHPKHVMEISSTTSISPVFIHFIGIFLTVLDVSAHPQDWLHFLSAQSSLDINKKNIPTKSTEIATQFEPNF